jgi:hypothetical protein
MKSIYKQTAYFKVITDPFYAYKTHFRLGHQSDSILKDASHLCRIRHSQTGKSRRYLILKGDHE